MDAVEVVSQRQYAAKTKEIEEAARELLARIPDCGKRTGAEVTYEEENPPARCCNEDVEENRAEANEKKQLFTDIFSLIFNRSDINISENCYAKLNLLTIDLKPDEKLLLKLCYQDDLNVSQSARLLGLSRFQAHGKMRRLLTKLKTEFQRIGLDDEIRTLLKTS